MNVIEALDTWVRRHGSRLRDTKNTVSIVRVLKAALKARKLDKTPLAKFGTAEANRLADEMLKEREASTVARNIGLLRRAIYWHRDRGEEVDPHIKWPSLKVTAKMRHLTPEETDALLKVLDPRERAWNQEVQDQYDLTVILLETGARLNEVCTLKWADVDLDKGTVKIERTKNETKAMLYLTKRAENVLRQRSARRDDASPYVFTDSDGGPRRTASVKGIRRALKEVAPGATIHSFRDTYATNLLDKGLPLADIGSILGHKKPQQTLKYAHFQPDRASARAKALLDGEE